MYSKVNYTVVGIFVLLFGAGMAFFAFWLAKYGLEESYYTYRVEMKESIAGLSKDSSVKLHGVDVGRVSEIRINPENIEVIEIILKIREEVPIKEDMFATTKMLGLTGLLSIEISGGTNVAKTLHPTKEYMPLIQSKISLLTNLTENLGSMSEKLEKLLTQSTKLLSDENVDTFSKILNHTETVTKKAVALEDKVMATLEDFNKSMAKMTLDFEQVTEDFKAIKTASLPTIEKLMETSKNFNRVTLKVEKSLDRGDYNLKKILAPVMVDTQLLLKELRALSRELEQNPSGLLFKSRKARRGPGE
ncbi:MAG: MCE family protein [Sulfurovum sp.]|nr:MCE family protein [Sulfurovum sp.]